MGELARTAKKNSNFLKMQKGESVIVRYDGYRIIPSRQDPNKDVVQYRLNEEGAVKFWENSNPRIMLFFDDLPTGTWVKISRNRCINQDGQEDTTKSTYTVDKVDVKTGEVKAWDE